MVIGNGIFSDTREDALKYMEETAGCKVVPSTYPTIGNICYYTSERGDVFGQQRIQGKYLTRKSKRERNNLGYRVRVQGLGKCQAWVTLEVLVYCDFVLKEWQPDIRLEAINGDPYDMRPDNFRPYRELIPPEWAERMKARAEVYKSEFKRMCHSLNYYTGFDMETCKDLVQQTFIYICTNGYKPNQHPTEITGLWVKMARLRARDYYVIQHRHCHVHNMVEYMGKRDSPYERDLFSLLHGKKRQRYARLYFEGYPPTEIAEMCGTTLGNVSGEVTRSVQFLRKWFGKEATT